MQHFHDIDELHLQDCELTIGSFDGVHIGHQALINKMVHAARENEIPSVVLTFYPHPSVVLRKRRPIFYINSPEDKAKCLGDFGVDYVITHPFNLELSRISAHEFLRWVKDCLNFTGLWIGDNFALGHNREGDIEFLDKVNDQYDFQLHIIDPIYSEGKIVSSTRVREALRAGDIDQVEMLLGRPFAISGIVQKGSGRGKKLGMPTANLKIWEELAYPNSGVYACRARIAGELLNAVTNIGIRPTFDENLEKPVVETHLLDFEGDLYGQEVEMIFVARLRDERRFEGPDQLIAQINVDIQRAREILIDRSEIQP